MKQLLLTLCVLLAFGVCQAESVGKTAADNSPQAEMAAFKLHPDFEINLFADESMGIANPVAMHWDHKGRLWVLTTLTYAQLQPGQSVNDKLIILEDTDQDGKADKSTVFAGGLDMPMGFALGYGGVYVGEGPDILFLKDTDGDDQADLREVVLTGFGIGDTHQNISNFTWGPDGCLYFAQGLHCFSRIETPWGIVRGDEAGFWRLHPKTLKLEPFCFPSMASQNPCGIGFDNEGAMFVKSNNKELIYVTPGLIPTKHQKNLGVIASIGSTPGKSMGAEYVVSNHLPDWLQNHMLVAGYYSNRVTAFPLIKEGAGFAKVEPVELMVSDHGSFRPVETRVGPDGAIYIADWFNPIIGHYQASLRHPDRDKKHGRVWRMTAKGRGLNDPSSWRMKETPDLIANPTLEEARVLVDGSDARSRLEGIVACAGIDELDSLPVALQALDHPRDRFIDYALEQTVHALAPHWLPAAKSGALAFSQPEHLAYALEILGGEDSRGIAKSKLSDTNLKPELRARFTRVLAKVGTPQEIRDLLNSSEVDTATLRGLIDSWATRKQRPASPFAPKLAELIQSGDEELRTAAIELVGLWKVETLGAPLSKVAEDAAISPEARVAALIAVSRLQGKEAIPFLKGIAEKSSELQLGVVEALTLSDAGLSAAANLAARPMASSGEAKWLEPFLVRKNGAAALAVALGELDPPMTADSASSLAMEMGRIGRSDQELLKVLNAARGVQSGALVYSPDKVSKIVESVKTNGDVTAGKEIFHKAEMTCVACHQIKGVGGILGPSLDTVGAGLPLDLIVESVLWPDRQLKEGYFSMSVTTKSGETYMGYSEGERDGVLHLRDTASGKVQTIPNGQIAERKNVGTLMPAGLTNSLKEEELRDLIAYLASLRG